MPYKKRKGTSGIKGQLYETKLICLLLFRAQHNDDIEDFNLASNMDEIGAFDDICLRAKIKGQEKPVMVFIQAKHRESANVKTLNNKKALMKYFESYLKIKKEFELNNQDDAFFKEPFNDTESIFIIYTNEKSNQDNMLVKNPLTNHLNELIATGELGSKTKRTEDDVQFLSKAIIKHEMTILAERVVKLLNDKNNQTLTNDQYIIRYHVILAQYVVEVTDIQTANRHCTYKKDFFYNNNEYLVIFREKLYSEILKKKKVDKKKMLEHVNLFLSDPSVETLCAIVGNIVGYKKGKFYFVNNLKDERKKEQLRAIKLPQSTVNQAIEIAAREILENFKSKVPPFFGNDDLTVRNLERISHIAGSIIDLINKFKPSKVITINENLGDGMLKINGGIGGAIGNVLILDGNTKIMKFTDNYLSLNMKAKLLYDEVKSKIDDINEYRFEVTAKQLPKLSLECTDDSLVREFLDKLIYYTAQADEKNVEKILKNEIEDHEGCSTRNCRIKSEAILLKYHDVIQKWWMSDDGDYITKKCNIYQNVVDSIVNNELVAITNMIYMNKVKTLGYTYSDKATESLQFLKTVQRALVITNTTLPTVIKVSQCFKGVDHLIFDLNYILLMLINEFNSLITELTNIDRNIHLIIVCDDLKDTIKLSKRLQKFAKAIETKKVIIVTTNLFIDIIKQYFLQIEQIYVDNKNTFADLSEESKEIIIKNTHVVFQGQKIDLNLLIDDVSAKFLEESLLEQLCSNKTLVIGETLTNAVYNESKELHIDRRVYCGDKSSDETGIVLKTLHDLSEDVVLITAEPGMGKSTLLTYLSLKTKQQDNNVWIVRINLIKYSPQFNNWKENCIETLDSLKTQKFLCQIVLKNKFVEINDVTFDLKEINCEVFLENCSGSEWVKFELKMFLHFYNRRNIIFLFDGFDEICPHYADQVIMLLNSLRELPIKHKMWITSRSYNRIKTKLEENFGSSYDIEPFDYVEQAMYLEKKWQAVFQWKELNELQLKKLEDFLVFMTETRSAQINKTFIMLLIRIYSHFNEYINNKKIFDKKYKINSFLRILINVSQADIKEFAGTPLNLHLIAEYLINEIKYKTNKTWDFKVNLYTIYENFLESKLRKRIVEKNDLNERIYNPDLINIYETVRNDFIAMHKKLAAYAIFPKEVFTKDELINIQNIIKTIREGKEKTGLIYSVENDVPLFIHMTFTEHFAVEYVSDVMKTEMNKERKDALWELFRGSLTSEKANCLSILEQKILTDDKLSDIIEVEYIPYESDEESVSSTIMSLPHVQDVPS